MKRRLARLWGYVGLTRLTTLSFVTFSHAFVAIAFFLQTILLAKILPVSEFGRLASALAVANVIESAVGARGAETALAAFARLPDDDSVARDALVSRLMRIDLAWSGSIYGILAFGVVGLDAWRETNSSLLLLLMIGSFLAFPWGTGKAYLTVFRGARAFPPVEIAFASTTLFLGVGLAYFMGNTGFVLATVLASLFRTIAALWKSRIPLRLLLSRNRAPIPLANRDLWRFGLTGTVRSGLMNFAGQMDILLLSAAASTTSVGLYRAGKTLSGLAQRATQPVWFVLKRHIIVGTTSAASTGARRVVVLVSLGFLLIGLVLVPLLAFFGGDIAAFAFGEAYRSAGVPMVWLVSGAWVLYAVTGWSGLFGSIASARFTVIGFYCVQIATFALVSLIWGVRQETIAIGLAISQMLVAACFWVLYLRSNERLQKS